MMALNVAAILIFLTCLIAGGVILRRRWRVWQAGCFAACRACGAPTAELDGFTCRCGRDVREYGIAVDTAPAMKRVAAVLVVTLTVAGAGAGLMGWWPRKPFHKTESTVFAAFVNDNGGAMEIRTCSALAGDPQNPTSQGWCIAMVSDPKTERIVTMEYDATVNRGTLFAVNGSCLARDVPLTYPMLEEWLAPISIGQGDFKSAFASMMVYVMRGRGLQPVTGSPQREALSWGGWRSSGGQQSGYQNTIGTHGKTPAVFLIGVSLVWLFAIWRIPSHAAAKSRKLLAQKLATPSCIQCGYRTDGLNSPACPECGADLRRTGIGAGLSFGRVGLLFTAVFAVGAAAGTAAPLGALLEHLVPVPWSVTRRVTLATPSSMAYKNATVEMKAVGVGDVWEHKRFKLTIDMLPGVTPQSASTFLRADEAKPWSAVSAEILAWMNKLALNTKMQAVQQEANHLAAECWQADAEARLKSFNPRGRSSKGGGGTAMASSFSKINTTHSDSSYDDVVMQAWCGLWGLGALVIIRGLWKRHRQLFSVGQ